MIGQTTTFRRLWQQVKTFFAGICAKSEKGTRSRAAPPVAAAGGPADAPDDLRLARLRALWALTDARERPSYRSAGPVVGVHVGHDHFRAVASNLV